MCNNTSGYPPTRRSAIRLADISGKKKLIINSGILGEIKSSKNTKISRIIILGPVKMTMTMNWLTLNQLKAHFLQKYMTYELL